MLLVNVFLVNLMQSNDIRIVIEDREKKIELKAAQIGLEAVKQSTFFIYFCMLRVGTVMAKRN